MNKKNILALARFIEKHKELSFDMAEPYNPECGSPGCIGGFAAALWPDVQDKYDGWDQIALRQKLDLSAIEHHDLCFPGQYVGKTRKVAVSVLRNLAETGEVSWP